MQATSQVGSLPMNQLERDLGSLFQELAKLSPEERQKVAETMYVPIRCGGTHYDENDKYLLMLGGKYEETDFYISPERLRSHGARQLAGTFSSHKAHLYSAELTNQEVELHARHHYLIDNATEEFRTKMETDPDYYDAKMAGFFVFGQCASVGDNWLQPKGLKALPMLSSAGGGIHGLTYSVQEQFTKLQARLKRVRVCCGDWKRIMTPSVLDKNKGLSPKDITAIFLDPPYSLDNRDKVYVHDQDVYREVAQWALDNGDNPRLRIAMCGYQGDAQFPAWQEYQWTGSGMGNMSDKRGKNNQSRECIWFSPNCLEINNNASHQ
jgi:hypothetical protein